VVLREEDLVSAGAQPRRKPGVLLLPVGRSNGRDARLRQ
jgi:hypothetical protein